jgi:branched-chain amino acid transport system substrate-binding protein
MFARHHTSISKGYLVLGLCVAVVLGIGKPAMSYTEYAFGITTPRSGHQAFVGDMALGGVETAVREINAKGGIDGVPMKVVVEDHQATPTMAVTALQKLISVNKVPIFLSMYSTCILAQVPLADKYKVLLVNMVGSSTELINSGEYIIHVQPNSASYLRICANYMCETLGLKKKRWVLFYQNDAAGRGYNNYMKSLLPKYGVTEMIIDNWEFGPATDFRGIVNRAMNFKADAVFLGGLGRENGLCLKQLKEAGFTGQVMAAYGGDMLKREVGGKTILNCYYGEQVIPDNERIRNLKRELEEVRKLTSWGAVQSINPYDSVYLIAETIKYAKDHYGGDYYTGEKLLKAVLEKKTFTSLSVPGTMDPEYRLLSRQLAVKTFQGKGGDVVEVTVKSYTDKEIDALPAGKIR